MYFYSQFQGQFKLSSIFIFYLQLYQNRTMMLQQSSSSHQSKNIHLQQLQQKLNNQHYAHYNIIHVSETFDPGIFRKTVQAKIKEKYQEQKVKDSSNPFSNSFADQEEEERKGRNRIFGAAKTEQRANTIEPLHSFPSYKRRVNSIQKIPKLKHKLLLDTSNLLTSPQHLRQRKSIINPKIKQQILSSYKQKKKTIYPKRDDSFGTKGIEMGYQMDGSIYHFQESHHVKTVPTQVEQNSHLRDRPVNRQEIYKVLKSTSPLNIRKHYLKDKKFTDMIPERKKLRIPSKLSNSHPRPIPLTSSLQTPKRLHFPKAQTTIYNPPHTQKEQISGWQYDEQY